MGTRHLSASMPIELGVESGSVPAVLPSCRPAVQADSGRGRAASPSGGSGRVRTKAAGKASTRHWRPTTYSGAPMRREAGGTAEIAIIALRLAGPEIALCLLHCSSGGPRRGCSRSQRCRRCEPRAKQKADSSRKGVVGSSGTRTPTSPKPRKRSPSPAQMIRTALRASGAASSSGGWRNAELFRAKDQV